MSGKKIKKSSRTSGSATLETIPTWMRPGVIMLGHDKKPIEKNWTTLGAKRYEAGANGLDLEGRWPALLAHEESGGNFGWIPPWGVVVIDADNEAAISLVLDHVDAKNTLLQQRHEGSAHFIFLVPKDETTTFYTRAGIKVPYAGDVARLDLRTWGYSDERKGGGQVVIPPSKHADGRDYRWRFLPRTQMDLQTIPKSLVEVLVPFLSRSSHPGAKSAGTIGPSRHDRVISFSARLACTLPRDPARAEREFPELVRGVTEYIERLFAEPREGETDAQRRERMKMEIADVDRVCRSAMDAFGGSNPEDEQTNDRILANLIIKEKGDVWRFGIEDGRMYEWCGSHWAATPDGILPRYVLDFVDHMIQDVREYFTGDDGQTRERRSALNKQISVLSNMSKITAIVRMIKSQRVISCRVLDTDPNLVAFPASGDGSIPALTMRWTDGSTYPSRKEDFITRCMGAPYAIDAHDDAVEAFLSSSLPDTATRESVMEMAAESMYGRIQSERLYMLHGRQGSGKSTLGYALVNVFGSYGKVINASTIAGGGSFDGSRKDFSLQALRGIRLAFGDEIELGLGSKMKELTSVGTMETSVKYSKDDLTFEKSHHIWIATNRRPKLSSEEGMKRRLIEIPMNAGASDQIEDLDYRVKEGMLYDPTMQTALVGEILRAHVRLIAAGENGVGKIVAVPSPAMRAATEEWLQEGNLLGEWLTYGTRKDPSGEGFIEQAYRVYVDWMHANRPDQRAFPRANPNVFAAQMASLGYEKRRVSGANRYHGLVEITEGDEGEAIGDARSRMGSLSHLRPRIRAKKADESN